MPSIIPGFAYDIFISYRQNDNRTGWVTEFVRSLETELAATIKEPVSVYFDLNPHDGLLETHQVDRSLEGKLNAFIFLPVISQTYCDPNSFAWKHEFCAFNRSTASTYIKLNDGNVASRILPVWIHEIDAHDRGMIETEIKGTLRGVEFIYRESGVNRPLKPSDSRTDNLSRTDYHNQVNKVANAVKELIRAHRDQPTQPPVQQINRRVFPYGMRWAAVAVLLALTLYSIYYFETRPATRAVAVDAILDRADEYLEEAERFGDKRYVSNAEQAIQKALDIDSLNERALYLAGLSARSADSTARFFAKLNRINPEGRYALMARAGQYAQGNRWAQSTALLDRVLAAYPEEKDALKMMVVAQWLSGNYEQALHFESRFEKLTGVGLPEFRSAIFLELGDFNEARRQLFIKQNQKEFSCQDIESLQRILLCAGDFEKLESLTDSICTRTKCEDCAFWQLRAKVHTGKYREAMPFVKPSLKAPKITWRTIAFALRMNGKTDSASILTLEELQLDMQRLGDTAYRQTIPMYSLAAIHAMQGNKEESIKWLRKYADEGWESGSEWYAIHDPLFNEAKKDPAFFADFMQIVQKAQTRKMAMRERMR